jgi:hypothetical protein
MGKKIFQLPFIIDRGKSILFFVILICLNSNIFSQQTEVMMKAVALEKISMFIDWPEAAHNSREPSDFVITVIGQNMFGTTLEELYKEEKIKDKKVTVNYLTANQNPGICDLLFISKIKINDLKRILTYIKGMPVLIVSNEEGFAETGCFVNMYEYENKLRFEINQKAMQEAGFKIDYRLLRVSKIINPVKE